MAPELKPKLFPVRFPGDSEFLDPESTASQEEPESLPARLAGFLRDSLQMQHLAVLAGSGTSWGKGPPTMGQLWEKATALEEYEPLPQALKEVTSEDGIETLLSRCDAFLSIHDGALDSAAGAVGRFRDQAVRVILEECKVLNTDTLTAHEVFLRKLARRRVRDSRLKLFTTNYDLAFETAAERLGQVAIDGFSYSFPRVFNPRYFTFDLVERGREHDVTAFAPGVFQYFKLHGSVNWVRKGTGVGERLIIQTDHVTAEDVALIYPTRRKYQLSYDQPHLELMTHYLACLREPNACLLVVGFGFNDSHLTEPILSALRATPGFRLIVVDPCARKNLRAGNDVWLKIDAMVKSGEVDVTFVNAGFDDFVAAIPDLGVLPPAEHLAMHLRRVLKENP